VSETRNKVLGGAVFVVCLCALQYFSGELELNRQRVLSGEMWRIWTSHFVHTDILHLSLNILAGLVIYFAFFSKIRAGELLAASFVLTALISVALLLIYPGLDWYNGLSGLLHALVACFSIRMVSNGDRVYWAGLGIVWLKVLVEATRANLGYEYLIGDMTVITEAHLIGVSTGTITAVVGMVFWHRTGQPERRLMKGGRPGPCTVLQPGGIRQISSR